MKTGLIIREIVLLLLSGGIGVWVFIRAYKRSEEPGALVLKWVLTVPILWYIFMRVMPLGAQGGYAAAGSVIQSLILGLTLAIIWRKSIASIIATPFGDLYDGGDRQIEKQAYYSVAQSKRKRGKYEEAVAEIRKQLEQFPNDFDGQILLAEIQAENLVDLPGAEVTIQRLCAQPGHPPRSIAYAFNMLADWHLKLCQDPEAARQALEKIIELMPDSEMSARASQRIAHLASRDHLLAYHDRQRIVVKPGAPDAGLFPSEVRATAPPDVDPAKQTAEYVKHLEQHPLDTDAREKLAVLYADHYGRLDAATEQLEQMIAHPGQSPRRVAHWLNLLADVQIRHAANHETVRQTLQRIIDMYPDSPAAEMARNRMSVLKLQIKGQEKGQTVKMGNYDQDIGLKSRLPKEP